MLCAAFSQAAGLTCLLHNIAQSCIKEQHSSGHMPRLSDG